MTFIHPLLLGGLLLVGVPVLIHLIMQQKPKQLPFPAFRFLLQRHRTNQRRLRLRHLLLMALRMALIVLFCLALARPRLFSERIGVGSERPVAAVLLFDTSMSMEYRVGERSRLDEAKRRAQELLDTLPDGSRVAVLDSGELAPEWQKNLTLARETVAALKLRPNSGPVTRQIGQAYRLFDVLEEEQKQEPGTEPLARFVYLFSDRTQAAWDQNEIKNLKQPERTNAAFVDVGVKEPQDIALGIPELTQAVVAPGESIEVRVPVRATGMACDTVIGWQIDDEPEEKKQVQLQAGQSEVVLFRRPVKGLAAGPHQIRVKLASSDALPFNNECYAAFEVRAGRSILVLADQPSEAAIWREALKATGFRVVVQPMKQELPAPADLLKTYPAVCLLSVAQPDTGSNSEIWARLREYVRKGGGLAVIPGGEELIKVAYNSPEAAQVLPASLESIVKAPKEPGVGWDEGASQHALLTPFKEWRKSANVDFQREERRPAANRYWEVKPYVGGVEVVVPYAGEPRRPALVERKLDQGRVLLFTVPLDRRSPPWHNYWNESSFGLVLADKAIGYLAGDAEKVNFNYLSGQPVTVQFPPVPYHPEYTLLGPGLAGAETKFRRPGESNSAQVTQAVLPGQYTVFSEEGLVARFSLNVRAEESQLTDRVPAEQIEALLGPGSMLTVDQGTNLRDALQGRWLQPWELFPWLMIGLLLALAVENLLSNKFYRKPTPELEEQRAA